MVGEVKSTDNTQDAIKTLSSTRLFALDWHGVIYPVTREPVTQ